MLLMPFAGFTPLSVFSLEPASCTAKPSTTEETLYTKPYLHVVLFYFPNRGRILHSVVLAGSETPASLGVTHLHLQIALGQISRNGQRRCAEAEQSYENTELQFYLPAFSEHLHASTNLQRQWDLNMGWFVSCAWTNNPVSQPNIYTVMVSQKEVMHIPHYTQYCWPVSLNISKRKAILNSSVLSTFPFLEN